MSSELVTLEEGAVFTPVFCDGEGGPLPEVSWWFEGAEVSLENTLDFTEPVTRWDLDIFCPKYLWIVQESEWRILVSHFKHSRDAGAICQCGHPTQTCM